MSEASEILLRSTGAPYSSQRGLDLKFSRDLRATASGPPSTSASSTLASPGSQLLMLMAGLPPSVLE